MITDLISLPQQLTLDLPIAHAGRAANIAASARAFAQYRERLSDHTRIRHDTDLACFAAYLVAIGVYIETAHQLATDPAAWAGVTWGLVAGFVAWQSSEGYARTRQTLKAARR